MGLQTILTANGIDLALKRYDPDTGKLILSGSIIPGACVPREGSPVVIERSIWPKENLCITFCIHYSERPCEDEQLILDMTLEQLICASEHLPSDRDEDIDKTLLSRREREVLPLVAAAKTNGQIATELGISERTVEKHVASILEKTGLGNRKMIIAASQCARASSPQQNRNHNNFSSHNQFGESKEEPPSAGTRSSRGGDPDSAATLKKAGFSARDCVDSSRFPAWILD